MYFNIKFAKFASKVHRRRARPKETTQGVEGDD